MKQFAFTTALLLGAVSGLGAAQSAPPRASFKSSESASARNAVRAPAKPKSSLFPDRAGEVLSTNLRSVYDPSFRPSGPILPAPENGGGVALGTCACSGAPAEGEANCGLPSDNFNGGCNYLPHVYSAITLGSSVCGTAAFDGGTRDTDWYRFTLTTTTTVVWTVRAEYPVEVLFLTDVCPTSAIAQNFGPACTDTSITATLAPGSYIAWTGPDFSGPVINCGTSDDYHATLIGVSSCSYDDGVSNDSIGLGSFGGGEELYLHKMGGLGEFAQVNSISMAWGTPLFPGNAVPANTPATIRIFKDPDDDGVPDDLVQVASKGFLTAPPDTDILQTVTFNSPVHISGVYFIGVSLHSGSGQYPLAIDYDNPSANRGWLCFETNGSGGNINYANLPSNDFFGENSTFGVNGVYLLRADCQPEPGGCAYDDADSETTGGYGFAGEKLFLHRYGSPGDVSTVTSVSMSWGSNDIPGFTVPNGSSAQVRIFRDQNDDGDLADGLQTYSQGFLTAGADTGGFQTVVLTTPVVVRGNYFVGVSVVAGVNQFPMGFDTSTASGGRAWFVAQNGGAINYANLPSNTNYGPIPTSYGGLDGVHMLRADCHPEDEITAFCAPGVGGIVTCPCGNPQVPAGSTKGCNNFAGGGTGGAILAGSGAAVISGDTLAMNVSQGVASNVTVLFQGTTNTANTRTGAGVRCVGGTLKRLYKGNQALGSIAFPNNAVPFHTQSIAKGYTIIPPITLYYYAAYRNSAANGQPGCPGLNFGFNSTNALAVIWTP